ncbi:MAG: T9SS type A sorting domain-containing protein, partial [Bacteroidales bacterium]|nr:T9SS type A sorting domain-containing protein [Bacteroidales bacterium]
PNGGAFSLELPVAATVEVFASNGILQQRLESGAGTVRLQVNRSGIYFLRITGNGLNAVYKVVIR